MTISLQFFYDAAGVTPVSAFAPIYAKQDDGGALPPVDKVVYLLSAATDKKFQALSDPGVDPIVVSVVDDASTPTQPVAGVSLALSQVDLDSATPGDPLALANTLLSGAVNGVEVWVRIDDQTLASGLYLNLSLQTNDLEETDV